MKPHACLYSVIPIQLTFLRLQKYYNFIGCANKMLKSVGFDTSALHFLQKHTKKQFFYTKYLDR